MFHRNMNIRQAGSQPDGQTRRSLSVMAERMYSGVRRRRGNAASMPRHSLSILAPRHRSASSRHKSEAVSSECKRKRTRIEEERQCTLCATLNTGSMPDGRKLSESSLIHDGGPLQQRRATCGRTALLARGLFFHLNPYPVTFMETIVRQRPGTSASIYFTVTGLLLSALIISCFRREKFRRSANSLN